MNTLMLLMLSAFTMATLVAALIYSVGIVWRVELELDRSYKFLAMAVLLFLVSEIFSHVPVSEDNFLWALASQGVRLLAAVLLFLALFSMRTLIRHIDGEIPARKK